MYIESEFMLLEAQNELLTRENKKLRATLSKIANPPISPPIDKNYWMVNIAQQALGPDECTCLPELPDGRVNGGRGGCCPVCEGESQRKEIPYKWTSHTLS